MGAGLSFGKISVDYALGMVGDASQVHRGELTGEAIAKFTDLAYHEFYLRPSFIFRKVRQFLFSPKERSRIFFGFRFFMKKIFTREKI